MRVGDENKGAGVNFPSERAIRTARVGLAYALMAFPGTLVTMCFGAFSILEARGVEMNPPAFIAFMGLQLLVVWPALASCSLAFAIYKLPRLVNRGSLRPASIVGVGLGFALLAVICLAGLVYGGMAFTPLLLFLSGGPVFAVFVVYAAWIWGKTSTLRGVDERSGALHPQRER